MNWPLSLSGVELDGDSLVRFVFLDESGISANESVTVVAGVIVHADLQWKEVEKALFDLADKYLTATSGPAGVPESIRKNFSSMQKTCFMEAARFLTDARIRLSNQENYSWRFLASRHDFTFLSFLVTSKKGILS